MLDGLFADPIATETMRPLAATFLLAFVHVQPAPAAESAAMNALASITSADLRRHAEHLADDTLEGREAGTRGGQAAAHYIGREFQRHHLAGGANARSYFQTFGAQYRNILGLLEGTDPQLKDEVIVVGAHYDHVGYGNAQNSYGPTGYIHNGADDNASGVAGLLEIVEAFSRFEQKPRRTVLFAFWDGEEKGLLGSEHWVAHPTVPLEKVKLAVNLDMIGRLKRDRMETYGIRTAYGLRRLLSLSNAESDLTFDFSWTMREDSDHYSFYKRNVPVLMLHTGLHSDYHRPSDDVEKLDFVGMERITRMLFDLVRNVANEPRLSGFRGAARSEASESRQRREQPLTPVAPRLGVVWNQSDEGQGRGLRVLNVASGSSASRAGLRAGDRILRFNGNDVTLGADLRGLVLAAEKPVTLTIARDGSAQPINLSFELVGPPVRLGLSWRSDDAEPRTVIVSRVVPSSPVAKAGIQVNDRIYEVSGRPFANDAEFRRLLADANGKELDFLTEREGRVRTVPIKFPDSVSK